MPLLHTERAIYTDVVKGVAKNETEMGVDYHFARADCEGSGAIEPMGVPMVWVAANTAFEPYIAQTIPTTDSSLPDGSPVCIVVGQIEGKGVNKADVTLSGTSQDLTVIYRGAAAVLDEGITWNVGTNAANQLLFRTALEKQGIAVISSATAADPAFVTI